MREQQTQASCNASDQSDRVGLQRQGETYQRLEAGPNGELISQVLSFTLVLWIGTYKGDLCNKKSISKPI